MRAGKIRYAGYSNYAAWQMADADWTARVERLVRPISAQDHYNLLARDVEREVLPACRAFRLGFIPYFPLESGFLTGKYRRDSTPAGARLGESPRAQRVLTPANFDRLERLERFAADRGHAVGELAFAWLLARREVSTVIASASSAEQVHRNVQAATWRLAPADIDALDAPDTT